MGVVTNVWDLVKGSFDFDPATPGIFGGGEAGGLSSTADILGGLYTTYRGSNPQPTFLGVAPTAGGATPATTPPMYTTTGTGRQAVGCISQRDVDIAAAAGTSPEMVDLVLKLGRRNRRRKRMLTKSDIADISTMKAVLGGGKAFELWLAKATH